MLVARVKHVEDDDESHFVGQLEAIPHRDVNVLLHVYAAVAEPPDAARFRLQLLILSINHGILFTRDERLLIARKLAQRRPHRLTLAACCSMK